MMQPWENGNNPNFKPNLGPLIFSMGLTYAISRKTTNQTWKNAKKPNLGTDFGPFDPSLGRQIFFQKSGVVSD